MKIQAIFKTNCPKCEWAKDKLKDCPVEWLNFDTDEEARKLVRRHDLNMVPVFLVFQDNGNVIITQSVLSVRKFIE